MSIIQRPPKFRPARRHATTTTRIPSLAMKREIQWIRSFSHCHGYGQWADLHRADAWPERASHCRLESRGERSVLSSGLVTIRDARCSPTSREIDTGLISRGRRHGAKTIRVIESFAKIAAAIDFCGRIARNPSTKMVTPFAISLPHQLCVSLTQSPLLMQRSMRARWKKKRVNLACKSTIVGNNDV